MSKAISVCFGFALLRCAIGLNNSRHFVNQSEKKATTKGDWRAKIFPHFASGKHLLGVLIGSLDCPVFSDLVIGQSENFGFSFTVLKLSHFGR